MAGELACVLCSGLDLARLCLLVLLLSYRAAAIARAQHYTLGVPRWLQDGVLAILSVLMLASMHAVQVSHLHHHRHCLDENDAEGSTARLRWWHAIAIGPLFVVRLHLSAWQIGSAVKRRWMIVELLGIVSFVFAVVLVLPVEGLRWHIAAMFAGESLTGFFAVWTVHHGCEAEGTMARTQRGRWITWLSYSMFFHEEHHLFPAVPTCRLARLAARIDAAAPESGRAMVIGLGKELSRKR